MSQTLQLDPGWNAVCLEVDPSPNDCDTLFQGVPVESVWKWNRSFSTVQFIQDPETLVPEQPEWLTYLPVFSPASSVTNLFTLRGGHAYLVKISGAESVDWHIVGRPVVRSPDWRAGSFNLVGFWVDPNFPPTFEEFFAPSSAHDGQPIFRLNSAGAWEEVTNPASERLESGEAYWIFSNGPSRYAGPLGVTFEQIDGLHFGSLLMEQTVKLRNLSANTRNFDLRLLSSESPIDTKEPALAGTVPLSFYQRAPNVVDSTWTPLTGILSESVASGDELPLRLEVRRQDMADFTPLAGRSGLYQSLLEVTDGHGMRILLPVSSAGRQSQVSTPGAGGGAGLGSSTTDENVGLWIGTASVNKVSEPASPSAPNTPVATATEFQSACSCMSMGPARRDFLTKPSSCSSPVL